MFLIKNYHRCKCFNVPFSRLRSISFSLLDALLNVVDKKILNALKSPKCKIDWIT